jgi:predicted nucleotidyltransferase
MKDLDKIRAFEWYRGNLDWLQGRTIFLTVHGSQCYGTATPESDIDVKGVAVAPRSYYLGNVKSFEVADSQKAPGDIDYAIYDLKAFFVLASKCNPNIIEILFTDPSDWIIPGGERSFSPIWERVWEHRREFVTKQARHSFSGYAFDQLRRIRTHRGFLLNPPKAAPARADYGLPEGQPTLGKEQLGIIEARIRKIGDELGGKGYTKDKLEALDPELVDQVVSENNIARELIPVIIAERRFANACKTWTQYQNHKKTRNAKRAELEAKFGYDTKHAMHLVRLLRMAREILTTGEVRVRRPDAEELLAIRGGAWSYDRLVEWAEAEEAALPALAEHSMLPWGPNREKLDDLLVDILADTVRLDSEAERALRGQRGPVQGGEISYLLRRGQT